LFSCLILVGLAASCGDDGAETSESNDAATEERGPELRLIGDVEPTPVSLDGTVDSSDVTTVLSFNAGAGDIPGCDFFFSGDDDSIEVEPGVGVSTYGVSPDLTGAAPTDAAVGYMTDICLAGWDDDVTGDLRLPDGTEVELPTRGESSFGPGLELHHNESSDGNVVFQLATYPGAALGTYTLEADDGDRNVNLDLDVATGLDRASFSNHFEFSVYDVFFKGNGGSLVVEDQANYGFVGFQPHEQLDLMLFRSPGTDDASSFVNGLYNLSAELTVETDDRGEATLILPLDEDASGHCFVLELEAAIADAYYQSGQLGVTGHDPTSFCVGGTPAPDPEPPVIEAD
jgi:hypothetical protein